MKLKVQHNFEAFRKLLTKAGREVDSLAPVLREWSTRFMESRKFIFDPARKGPGQYKDLSPAYKRFKIRRYGFAYPILLRTGVLAESITQKGSDNILIIGKKNLVIGSRVEYAAPVQALRTFLFWGPESRFAGLRQVRETNEQLAFMLYRYIERAMGKTLKASTDTANRKVRDVFGK